jgi:CBS domain containing-hemolysin-like protein
MKVLDNFDGAITTILICTNLLQIAIASITTVYAARRWGVSSIGIVTIAVTIILYLFGEMLPKSIAKKYSEKSSLAVASLLCLFVSLLRPATALLTALSRRISSRAGGEGEITVTEDELYDIIETMTDEGNIDAEKGELISSALSFADVTVESILTSRVDLVAIDIDNSIDAVLKCFKENRHSRIPVYEGNIDNIIGILQLRKFYREYMKKGESLNLRELLDVALYVHQSTKVDELLPSLSRKKMNMAIVTDNYGGTVGIVTVEDILEELVGEIWDEDDDVVESFVDLGHGRYEIDASMTVEDAFELMDYDDPDGLDFGRKLMSEWAYEQFDTLPIQGDVFTYNGLDIAVSVMQQHRIVKLEAHKIDGQSQAGDGEQI